MGVEISEELNLNWQIEMEILVQLENIKDKRISHDAVSF